MQYEATATTVTRDHQRPVDKLDESTSRISGRPPLRSTSLSNPAFSKTRDEPTNRPMERELRDRSIGQASTRRAPFCGEIDAALDQAMRDAPAARLGADEKARDRPHGRIGSVGGIDRRRAPALVVPFGHVGAWPDLHPANRTAILESQHAGRRAGFDTRLDMVLVAFAAALAAAPPAPVGNACTNSRSRRLACQKGPRIQARAQAPGALSSCSCSSPQASLSLALHCRTIAFVLFMFAAMAAPVNNPDHGFCRDCLTFQRRRPAAAALRLPAPCPPSAALPR